MITKPIRMNKISNFPRKAEPFFNGFRFENKYFSTNYGHVWKGFNTEYPSSKDCEVFSFKMKVYSDSFSIDHFGNDGIRIHETVFRTAFVTLNMLPIGFHLYFDSRTKAIKSQFYFLNFNKLTDDKAVKGDISKASFKTLSSKIKEKVGNHASFSFEQPKSPLEPISTECTTLRDLKFNSPESLESVLFNFSRMFGDMDHRKATDRALRGLPLSKANDMVKNINALLDIAGDSSIPKLSVPKKSSAKPPKPEKPVHIDKRNSENLAQYLGIDDFLKG